MLLFVCEQDKHTRDSPEKIKIVLAPFGFFISFMGYRTATIIYQPTYP